MRNLWKLALIVLLCVGTDIVNADDTARSLDTEADRVVAVFEGYSKKDVEAMSRTTTNGAVVAFQSAVELIQKVSLSDMSEANKAAIVARLADSAGAFFERMSAEFAPQPEKADTWDELGKMRSYENKFVRSMKWGWDRFAGFFTQVWRDTLRVIPLAPDDQGQWRMAWPAVFPFFGVDRDRSIAAKAMAKSIADKLGNEMNNLGKAVENPLVLAGIKRMLETMEKSVPVQDGARNLRMRRVYMGLAIFCFLNPPLELFIERTTYSPLISAILWSGAMLYAMRVRNLDSGLASYKIVNKMLKAIEKDPAKKQAWERCSKALENVGAHPRRGKFAADA